MNLLLNKHTAFDSFLKSNFMDVNPINNIEPEKG
jgi:hypothetical protein